MIIGDSDVGDILGDEKISNLLVSGKRMLVTILLVDDNFACRRHGLHLVDIKFIMTP